MNIVYLHSHDTGRWIEPYGHAVPTPNLRRLADEGVMFRQAFAVSPTCSPSRSALLTGMTPHNNGMIGLTHLGYRLNDPKRHLASYLAEYGYETVLSGIQHEISPARTAEIGYSLDLNTDNHAADLTDKDVASARLAAQYIRSGRSGRPFFLSVGLFHTHRIDGTFPRPLNNRRAQPDHVMPPYPLADRPQVRADMAGFIDSASVMDHCAGIVLDALDEAGLTGNTIVFYTTDHGPAFPGMKGQLHDTGIGVSLIMRLPERCGAPMGRTCDALVSHLDVFPTLCEWLGLRPPAWLQGTSLVPLLTGEADRVRGHLFAETNYHVAYEPARCIRTERYKLIRLHGPDDQPVLCNADDGPVKAMLLDGGLRDIRTDKTQLYDLLLDPYETNNRAEDSSCRDVLDQLSGTLDEWMSVTDDPLLAGTVPAPEGARIGKRSFVSPSELDRDGRNGYA